MGVVKKKTVTNSSFVSLEQPGFPHWSQRAGRFWDRKNFNFNFNLILFAQNRKKPLRSSLNHFLFSSAAFSMTSNFKTAVQNAFRPSKHAFQPSKPAESQHACRLGWSLRETLPDKTCNYSVEKALLRKPNTFPNGLSQAPLFRTNSLYQEKRGKENN